MCLRVAEDEREGLAAAFEERLAQRDRLRQSSLNRGTFREMDDEALPHPVGERVKRQLSGVRHGGPAARVRQACRRLMIAAYVWVREGARPGVSSSLKRPILKW